MGSQGFLGEFEQLVLLAVIQEGDSAFALEVRRMIEDRTGRSISRGAFYTTLDRLERKGMATWTQETPKDQRRRAPLRLYRVTPEGLDALRESRRALDSLSRGLDALLERGR